MKLRIVPFPPTTLADADTDPLFSHLQIVDATSQIAQILRLDVSPALMRIIEEYRLDTTISLCGEANAAREWIENSRRNRTGQTMTPAFFRRWLKREREEVLSRQAQCLQATGTTGREFASSSMRESHIKELVSFVNGIDRDYEAVRAGITYSWSQGPVEGTVNKIKTHKRLMYGRAGFPLLRQKMLCQVKTMTRMPVSQAR